MDSDFTNELGELFESLRQQQAVMAEAQVKVREVSATVTARKRALTVTVDAQGNVTELSFPTEAYRKMAPRELAALIQETFVKARQDVARQVAELMAPFIPDGVSLEDIAKGEMDWDSIVPPVPGNLGDLFGPK